MFQPETSFVPQAVQLYPLPAEFEQQGQDCLQQLLVSHSECQSMLAAGEMILFLYCVDCRAKAVSFKWP